MAFDPKRYVIKVQGGREYLPVSARLIWFRQDHPDWGIVTEAVEINWEKQFAIFRASIFNEEGRLIATATKREDVRGFGDWLEKAETGSVGRALALCGYGAQFAPELEEGGQYPGGRGGGGGGNMNRGAAPQRPSYGPPQRVAPPTNRPAPAPVDDSPFDEAPEPPVAAVRPQERPAPRPTPPAPELSDELPPLRPASSLPRPAPRQMPQEPAPVQARPAPAGGGIQRVREPERETPDPGGSEEDLDDPFAEIEDLAPPPPPRNAARPTPQARPTRPTKPTSDSLL